MTRKPILLLLIIVLIAVSCNQNSDLQSDTFWDKQAQISILDFEEIALSNITETATRTDIISNQGVTNGKQALKINLKADEKFTGIEFRPNKPIDVSALGDLALVFDATNVGERSVHLQVIVENEEGFTRRRSVSLPVGTTATYFFELENKYLSKGSDTNLRDNPNPYPESKSVQMKMRGLIKEIDYSKIAAIQFYTKYTLYDKTMILDNVRLVESPPLPADYLMDIVDKFGQPAKKNFEGKVSSDEELKTLAEAELKQLAVEGTMKGRSQYGGWIDGPNLEATGYFRTEKVGEKWALVDPEGYLFFSSGIANVRMANTTSFTGIDFKNEKVRYRDPEDVTPEDSRGMVKLEEAITSTAYVAYPMRNQMFTELPSYDDPLANHFSYRREQHIGPFAHGETFSHYQANLERRYGEPIEDAHLEKWKDVTYQRFLNWGFTSFGNWAGYEFYHENRMPYFANGWIIGDFHTVKSGMDYWGEMPDVFDPEFERRAKVTVDVVAEEVKGNPWCIGVFIDNEKSWGVPGSTAGQYGIVLHALTHSTTESPIKQQFTQLLKTKYKTIEALNTAWKTETASWSVFEKGVNYLENETFSEAMIADLSMLLEAYATKYFQVVHDALEAKMPNHLYMGCRFASWGMGKEVIAASGKFVDVYSYNFYEEGIGKKHWQFLEDIDRPAIIGEFHIGSAASGLFHYGVVHAADNEDRAAMYKDYLHSVIDNPYFVGAHWFQYIDSPTSGRAHDGENYNVGFVRITDVPYETMVKAAKEVHEALYDRRFGE